MIGLGSDENRDTQTATDSSDAKRKYRKAALHWCKFDSIQVHQRAKIIKLEGIRISVGAKTDITKMRSCRNTNTINTISKDATTNI